VQFTEEAEALEALLSVAPADYLSKVQEYAESKAVSDRRRNRFLDHLLARFAEEFKDYYALAEHVYGAEAQQRLIENKQRILQNMVAWSSERARAENLLGSDLTPPNLSGLEYRLRLFLGAAKGPMEMYLFEHILLLLDNDVPEQTLPVCTDAQGKRIAGFDPYSFRITLVLPGETALLSHLRFRQYLERLIREATPSHIVPKICWVSDAQMGQWGEAYGKWRQAYRLLSSFRRRQESLPPGLRDRYNQNPRGTLSVDDLAQFLGYQDKSDLEKVLPAVDVKDLAERMAKEWNQFQPKTSITLEEARTFCAHLVLLLEVYLDSTRTPLRTRLNALESIYPEAKLGRPSPAPAAEEDTGVILDYTKLGTL
jgi:hypothetical protein